MVIETIVVKRRFRYLWLKNVTGVSLSQHCAKCLKGPYDNDLKKSVDEAQGPFELRNGVWYLCGVAQPYRWEENFHLAFAYKEGSRVDVDFLGIEAHISDAVRLPVHERYIDPTDPNAQKKEYRTCRNWQFAHWLNSVGRPLLP